MGRELSLTWQEYTCLIVHDAGLQPTGISWQRDTWDSCLSKFVPTSLLAPRLRMVGNATSPTMMMNDESWMMSDGDEENQYHFS